jgi:hypothetical protein
MPAHRLPENKTRGGWEQWLAVHSTQNKQNIQNHKSWNYPQVGWITTSYLHYRNLLRRPISAMVLACIAVERGVWRGGEGSLTPGPGTIHIEEYIEGN